MKKFLVYVIMFMLSVALILFSGCNGNQPLQSTQSENEISSQAVSPTSSPTQKPTEEPEKTNSGILVVSCSNRDKTVKLDWIDPSSGKVSHYKTFSCDDNHSLEITSVGSNTTETKRCFDKNYSKITGNCELSDGSHHIGWFDENGNFTDVSEKITEKSDFSGLTKHYSPHFFDNYFYFWDATNKYGQAKRVPIDSLTPNSVEVLLDNVKSGGSSYPLADGSVINSASSIREYYDASMKYPANTNIFTDWISESVCVGAEDDMIYKYHLDGEIPKLKWYSSRKALVPEIKGRENWGAIVSPDKENVAFLSRIKNDQSDGETNYGEIYLYTVSAEGGDPTKISTSYNFQKANIIESNKTGAMTSGLLDWTE